jgi:creatinase/prolidase-like protein
MRRGLIAWSREEVPASVLDARVARLQEKMPSAGLGVVFVYTSFARPSAVAWLTQFVPYWNEGLLAVPQTGAPVLLAAFSKRMHDWIRSVSHVGEVRSLPDLGRAAAAFLEERTPGVSRVGVLELDALPWRLAEPLLNSGHGPALTDATELFASIRQPADEAEIRLAKRAADIAAKALASISPGAGRVSEALSSIEASARLDGAEEVQPRLAPDLEKDATLRRFEGDCPLGARYAVELSVAYKAAWTRVTQCFSRSTPPQSWLHARKRMSSWAAGLSEATASAGPPPGEVAFWDVEACLGTQPFSIVSSSEGPARGSLPAGALACLSLKLDLADGPWLGGGPVVIGGRGPARLLV